MLIQQVKEMFSGVITSSDTVKFSCGDCDFVLTDGAIYSCVDGNLLPGFKKVSKIAQVERFVNAIK